jgi:hypothetical protein
LSKIFHIWREFVGCKLFSIFITSHVIQAALVIPGMFVDRHISLFVVNLLLLRSVDESAAVICPQLLQIKNFEKSDYYHLVYI